MEPSHIDGGAWATSGLQRIATYEFLDATAGDATGYLTFDGTRVDANQTLTVTAGDLDRVRWHAASGIGTDDVSMRASDGQHWSGWSTGAVRTVPARTPAPATASAEQALASGTLEAPSLAVLADGRSVMVWSTGTATSGTGVIRGVMLDASGNPIGGAGQSFQVPAETGSYKQYRPSVTALADGGYVVAWEANTETGNGLGVFQLRYDAAGNRVGSEERVPSATAPTQQIATVAGLQDGGWLVSWSSVGQDGSGYGVYQQRYAADGHTVGGEQRINTTTTNDQLQSRIAGLEDGGWVVTWYGTSAATAENVYQQRYATNGTAVGGEQMVNTTTANDQRYPTVSSLRDGGWVVVWTSMGQDGSGWGTYGRVYNADGSARTGEITLHTFTNKDQYEPVVAALGTGGFMVSWRSSGRSGGPASTGSYGIYARQFDADGTAAGGEFRVSNSINSMTEPYHFHPAIAARPDGGVAVAWNAPQVSGSGYTNGIYARTYPVAGADTGTTGDDVLFGSAGQDTLSGGTGADAFLFSDPSRGLDTITDFQTGIDRIEVVGSAFGGLPVGALDPSGFALNAAADAGDRFVFDTTTRILSYDADGIGSGAAVSLAYLTAGTISAADIRVVA